MVYFMDKYEIICEIGRGTFGVVWGAISKETGEVVAIKELKGACNYSEEDCRNVREIKALRKMNHPNIVKLKGYKKENNTLFLVFEAMECSLYERMRSRVGSFSEDEIRSFCFQIFQGLAHMHANGYFHRDLKPSNLLVFKDVIKIADLGLARESNGKPPYAFYVGTRPYRAPEVILGSPVYDPAVDMWAMGAIMAELFTLRPLFPGASSGDVMHKICRVIGSPTESTWSMGLHLARKINYKFPDLPGVPLDALLPSASSEALSLMDSLLSWNPCRRPTAMEALRHPFFFSCYSNVPWPFHRSQDLPWKQALLKPPATSSENGAIVSEDVDPIMEDLMRRVTETLFDF